MATKPANWRQLAQNLRLATYPLDLEELQEAIAAPGCHPDIWKLEPDLTPLHCIVRYAGSNSGSIDDDDGTAAAKMLIDAGANVLHQVKVLNGTNTVLQTADKYLKGKEQNFPKLFALLREADAKARSNDAGIG